MKDRNIVDSSGWLEYLADTPRAKWYATALEDPDSLVVPSVTILEVFKKVRRERGENEALVAASAMQAGLVVPLDATLALEAGMLDLPLANGIIYATARRSNATLWTQDEHFKGLPGVKYFPVK